MRLRAVEQVQQDDEHWYTDGPRYGRMESPVGISRIGSGQPLWAIVDLVLTGCHPCDSRVRCIRVAGRRGSEE